MTEKESQDVKSSTSNTAIFGMAIVLFVFTIMLVAFSVDMMNRFVLGIYATHEVPWDQKEILHLKPGPPGFQYDHSSQKIRFLGVVDEKTKSILEGLMPEETSGSGNRANAETGEGSRQAYLDAINKLAFESNKRQALDIINLLIMGGMFGALGSHLRSLTAFVNNACRNKLDLERWWTYYVIRPLTGFILGIVVVAVVQAGLFSTAGASRDPTLWWISLAILAGFGDREFGEKLRHLTKTLFGESSEKPESGTPAEAKTRNV